MSATSSRRMNTRKGHSYHRTTLAALMIGTPGSVLRQRAEGIYVLAANRRSKNVDCPQGAVLLGVKRADRESVRSRLAAIPSFCERVPARRQASVSSIFLT